LGEYSVIKGLENKGINLAAQICLKEEEVIMKKYKQISESKLNSLNPIGLLQSAIAVVPAVRYALGVGGVAAIVAIVLVGWKLEVQTAIFGTLIVFAFMVILVVFTVLAGLGSERLRPFALFFAGSVLLLMVSVAGLFVSCAFFDTPKTLPCLLRNTCTVKGSENGRYQKDWRSSSEGGVDSISGYGVKCEMPMVPPIKSVAVLGDRVVSITAPRELHEYKFDTYPGERLVVEAVDLSNNQDMFLCLKSASSEGGKQDAGGEGIARLNYRSNASGSIALQIWEARGRTGVYRLSLRDLAAASGTSLTYGKHAFGSFSGNQEADVYHFEGKSRDKVSLIVHDPNDSDGIIKPRVELLKVAGPKQLNPIAEGTGSGTIALNEELSENGTYKILVQNKLGTRGSYFVCLENEGSGEEGRLGWTRSEGVALLQPLELLSFIVPSISQASPVYHAVIAVGPRSNKEKSTFHIRDGEFVSISSPELSELKIKASIQSDKRGAKFEIYVKSRKAEAFSLELGKAREIKGGLVVELADIIKVGPSARSPGGRVVATGRCCVACGGTTSCGCAVDDSCGSCCSGGCCAI
jgi:hypothetical protein